MSHQLPMIDLLRCRIIFYTQYWYVCNNLDLFILKNYQAVALSSFQISQKGQDKLNIIITNPNVYPPSILRKISTVDKPFP